MTNREQLQEEIDYLLNENRELGIVFDRLQAELDKHEGTEWLTLYDALEPIIDDNRTQTRSNTKRITEILTLGGLMNEPQDTDCTSCEGRGSHIEVEPSDQHCDEEIPVTCPDCAGSGLAADQIERQLTIFDL